MEKPAANYSSFTIYRRILQLARPFWWHLLAFLLLSFLATPLALLTPLPIKLAVDSVLGDQPPPPLIRQLVPPVWDQPAAAAVVIATMVIVFAGLVLLQQSAMSLLRTYVAEKLLMDFRAQLFRHVQRLSLGYHDSNGSSDSVYRIQYDATTVQALIVDSLVPLVSAVFMAGGMIFVTAQLNLKLALVALAVCPPLVLLTASFGPRLRRQWREAKVLDSSTQSVVQEVLGSVRVVKAFSREDHEHARYRASYRVSMAALIKAMLQENMYALLTGLVIAAGTAAVLFVGIREVLSGTLLLGNLLLVMTYLKQLYDPLKTIGKQFSSKQKALASAERVFALLDEAPDVPERPAAKPLERARGEITLRDVSFAYPRSNPVLQGVSFHVRAGARVGIVGRTGAGKSTLMNLLTRFYDPVEGQILLDGMDLRDYRVADLRRQFSIVLQEPVLFSTTIAENIAYGRAGASQADVIAAAQAADAHNFITRLPNGYDTLVGERGMCLSGGERQRVSLARAFLRDTPILLLDEPTSSVDTRTERSIMEAMRRLMVNRTTFMIAHRISTLESCDLLFKVEHGRLTEVRHHELAIPPQPPGCGDDHLQRETQPTSAFSK